MPGGAWNHPVSLIDLYPTLTGLCGLPADRGKNENGLPLDGHNLRSLLVNPVAGTWDRPEAVATDLCKWSGPYDPALGSHTLRSTEWRFIRYENGDEELYDTAADPYGWKNLLCGKSSGESRMKAEELRALAPVDPDPVAELPEEALEALLWHPVEKRPSLSAGWRTV
jgi:arylsulfatase A-like enzyme